MRLVALLALGSLVASAAGAAAQQVAAPVARPTATDLYVSCYLFVRGTDVPEIEGGVVERFSALQCGIMGIRAITHREGDRPDRQYRFCLPKGSAESTDPGRAMAHTYIDFFHRRASAVSGIDGEAAFIIAMVSKWPCAPPVAR